jgi:TfoX/Sxy family transcriptional regulator of competence genes
VVEGKTDPAVLAAFDTMIEGVKGAERKGATMPYCSINGNMYAMINKANVIGLRLDDNDLQAFLLSGAKPFEGIPGFVNKGYAAIPQAMLADKKALQTWFRLSHNYASKLKPKPTVKR